MVCKNESFEGKSDKLIISGFGSSLCIYPNRLSYCYKILVGLIGLLYFLNKY